MSEVEKAVSALQETFSQAVLDVETFRGDTTVVVGREFILPVCEFLRHDPSCGFDFLAMLSAFRNTSGAMTALPKFITTPFSNF